jgi:hypothetical protein
MQIPLDEPPESNHIRFIPSENKPGREARAAIRKKFPGKARIAGDNSGKYVFGKVFDVSSSGVSVIIEDMLPWKKVVKIDIDIFHNGKRFVFSMQAVPVYNILVSGSGYKCGFQFGPPTPEAQKTLGALMESDSA